jgi:hypothetical protein
LEARQYQLPDPGECKYDDDHREGFHRVELSNTLFLLAARNAEERPSPFVRVEPTSHYLAMLPSVGTSAAAIPSKASLLTIIVLLADLGLRHGTLFAKVLEALNAKV